MIVFVFSIEYAVVIPSVWLFLKDLDPAVPEYFLGLVVGGYAFMALILQPVIGVWLDSRFIKETLVFQMWVVLVGNVMYFFSTSIWMLLIARLICGMGGTVFLSTSVYIIRSTTEMERSSFFSFQQAAMMGGSVIGPALNYPITLIPRTLFGGWLTISSYNSVGLIMVGLQLVVLFLFQAFFVEPENRSEPLQTNLKGLANLRSVISVVTVTVITVQFVAIFNMSALEVLVAPIFLAFFDLRQVGVSIFYMAMSFYMLVCSIGIGKFVAGRVSDRLMILLGWICLSAGVSVLLVAQLASAPHLPLWAFCGGVGVFAASSVFFECGTGALFSKLIVRQGGKAATSQSVLTMFQTLATFLGPLVVSPVFAKSFLYVLIMIAGLGAVFFLLYLCAYKLLYIAPEAAAKPVAENEEL